MNFPQPTAFRIGQFGEQPAQLAAGRARAIAERARVRVLGMYVNCPDLNRREHPLRWLIDRTWGTATKQVAAAKNWPARETIWREITTKLAAFEAVVADKAKLAEAVAEQARQMETAPVVSAPAPEPDRAAELFERLRARGVTIGVVSGKLIVEPGRLLSADDLDGLRRHKPAIVARLTAGQVVV